MSALLLSAAVAFGPAVAMADDYTGGPGDDTFTDNDLPDADNTIAGGDGADTLNGASGNDSISGDAGNDTLNGGAGNDTLNGGAGNDDVSGDTGNDRIFGDASITSPADVTLSGGDDTLEAGDGDGGGDQRTKGDGDITTSGNATLNGGDDQITGGDAVDLIWGDGVIIDCNLVCLLNGGDDTIASGDGGDAVTADGRILDSSGSATLFGGNDTVVTGDGADGITGDGSVVTSASGGTATLTGGADTITSGDGDDVITGDGSAYATTSGTAVLNGGNDVIYGGDGNDTIVGDGWASAAGSGSATLNGGADTIHGGNDDDVIYGETDALSTTQMLVGGDDLLYGDAGNDTIYGQSGNDQLFGGDGDDTLDGGIGNDYLCGDAGTNTLNGGAGADLRCAVDDNITVTEHGGVLDVAVNEQLADESAEDRDGRRYEIIEISSSLKAVMDAGTGRLTIISADGDGRIRYRVWLDSSDFQSFATVFVTFSPEPSKPEDEPEPEPSPVPPASLIPVVAPLPPDALADTAPPGAAAAGTPGAVGPNGVTSPGRDGIGVEEFMHSELAPAAEVTVAATLVAAITGGAGLSTASLSSAQPSSSAGSSGEKKAPNKRDGTKDGKFTERPGGEGPGDRSFTWRFPGHRWMDRLSVTVPVRVAPHSPLLGRLAWDGAELRAMLGTLWMLFPLAGIAIGAAAAHTTNSLSVPPPLSLLIAGAVLTTFDALAGALASAVFIGAGILSGAVWNPESPDLVHSLLVYCWIAFLWTSLPLVGSAIRPFRRLGHGSFRYAWDVVADLAIAALLCAWVTRGLMLSMDNFASVKTGLPAHADQVALIVLFCIAVRIGLEHLATRLYHGRLLAVEPQQNFPRATLLGALSGVALRTALFAFFGFSFIGPCWQWALGMFIYLVPQVFKALDTSFRRVSVIQKFLPQGITALFIILLAAALSIHMAASHTSSPLETMRWVFLLLSVPPLVFGVLESFTQDVKRRTTGWFAEILGLGVVMASAWLAFNGWNL